MNAIAANPIFGVSVTVIAYAVGQLIHRRVPQLPTLVTTCGLLIALLLVGHIDLADYNHGGDIVKFFLGPATIALGVPLYKQWARIRAHAPAVILSISAGTFAGIAVAELCTWACRGSNVLLRSMLAKGVTTPIAIEVSKQVGGQPELSAVFTVLAGLFGSIIGPKLLRLCGIRSDLAIGLAMGTSSHGIGTARVIRDSELQGGASGLAMALCGIITSIAAAVIAHFLL